MQVPEPELDRLRALYNRGLYLQAYQLARGHGPLEDWTGTAARLLAGRLAMALGAPRLGYRLHLRAWKEDRENSEARYFYVRVVRNRQGPLAAWGLIRRFGDFAGAAVSTQADWCALAGSIAGRFRDFDTAESWFDRAERLAPADPWIHVERAYLHGMEDRAAEALESARRALECQPWFRPGVQAVASCLQQLDRKTEAMELMQEASAHIESEAVMSELAVLLSELRHYDDAWQSLDRVEALSPLLEPPYAQWLAMMRCDVAYFRGDRAAAMTWARQAKSPFFDALAERLASPSAGGARAKLAVGFVRQHHQTCAPATLSALGRFWGMPVDHLDVAEAICYDGTPGHSQRHWAEQNGFVARDFTVTWDSARALLDRGVPFALTLESVTWSHLVAVIGYDVERGTMLLRDPSEPAEREIVAADFFSGPCARGLHGLAMVPREKAALLDGVELADTALHADYHRLQRALLEHRRDEADAACEATEARAAEHPLAIEARASLAAYDADASASLVCARRLCRLFPDDQRAQLRQLDCLHDLARREEHLESLRSVATRKDCDPVFWRRLADELSPDAREHDAAMRWLRRALRARPLDAPALHALAGLLWQEREFERATELYRFAACLEDKWERYAESYFIATRHLKQTDSALRFLEGRFHRFGKQSSLPGRTLFWALGQLERMPPAFEMLEKALELRPDDGELLLFAADEYCRHGKAERAEQLLAAAKPRSRHATWLRTAANLAAYRGHLKKALTLWQEIIGLEPLAMDAHRACARLLAETEDVAATLRHLQAAAERFPHHYGLHRLWLEWLRDEEPVAVEAAARRLAAINPDDAWARRELASTLADQRRFEESLVEAGVAEQLEPNASVTHATRGRVFMLAGDLAHAADAFRRAITLSVDDDYSIRELIVCCNSLAERRVELAFVQRELVRQTIFGDGLLAYRDHAQDSLRPDELLANLREALAARPDLWHAWSAVVCQLTDMGRLEEALSLAREATQRFPLLPQVWLDLARLCFARGDRDDERAALQEALAINPAWSLAARNLADHYERTGDLLQMRNVLERAVALDPLAAGNHRRLASALWVLGETNAAVERLQQAVRLDPGHAGAWDALRRYANKSGQPTAATDLARELTCRRAGDARSWMALARVLDAPSELEESLAAFDRVLALSPRWIEAHDLRVTRLVSAKRWDEARAACNPPAFGGKPPMELRGRVAWLAAERGDKKAAIVEMQALLKDEPAYLWGWRQLADWCDDLNMQPQHLEACHEIVRLAPHEAMSHGFLGYARLRNGDRPAAKRDFQRAMELSPAYVFGGEQLFTLQLEDNELEAAAATLERLRPYQTALQCHIRGTQLASRRRKLADAKRALREICVSAEADSGSLDTALGAMRDAGWLEEAARVFEDTAASPEVNPVVGRVWVKMIASWRRGNEAQRLAERLADVPRVGIEAMTAAVDALAEPWNGTRTGIPLFDFVLEFLGKGEARWRLRRFVARNRARLRADTALWGEAGYALANQDDMRGAAEWLAGYARRADVMPWMLHNLALALNWLGRSEEAIAVSRHALTLPADHTAGKHHLLLGANAVCAGRMEAAAEHLAAATGEPGSELHRCLRTMVSACVRGSRATERRVQALTAAWSEVRALSQESPVRMRTDRFLKRVRAACARELIWKQRRVLGLTRALLVRLGI